MDGDEKGGSIMEKGKVVFAVVDMVAVIVLIFAVLFYLDSAEKLKRTNLQNIELNYEVERLSSELKKEKAKNWEDTDTVTEGEEEATPEQKVQEEPKSSSGVIAGSNLPQGGLFGIGWMTPEVLAIIAAVFFLGILLAVCLSFVVGRLLFREERENAQKLMKKIPN